MRSGIADTSNGHVEQRDVIVKRNIIRPLSEDAFVPPNVFSKHFLTKFTLKPNAIRRVMGDDLNPKIAHLVGGVLAPVHTPWRLLGVAGMLRGIIVAVPHRECRSFRHREWCQITVRVLPIEIPVRDTNQPLSSSVG